MVAELTALRDQIDEVDKALLDLLARRMALVAEVGEVKSKYGLPIYVPEREASMLASRRKEAQALGVSPDLIEDVLRRVMRESYSSENDKGFKTLCPSLRPVVIVGGAGQMGRLFEKMLTLSGYQVRILEKEDWAHAPELMKDAGMVIVSVPIHVTEQIIGKLPALPKDCILVDLASVKNGPLQAMLAAHTGPVLGLHPMFGPDSGAWLSRWWFTATVVSRKPISGSWNRFRYGARDCTASARSSTTRTWRSFRRCATLRRLPTVCIWRKRTCSLNSCWRSLHLSIVWSWQWSGVCLLRIRSFTRTLLCPPRTTWRSSSATISALAKPLRCWSTETSRRLSTVSARSSTGLAITRSVSRVRAGRCCARQMTVASNAMMYILKASNAGFFYFGELSWPNRSCC